MRPWPALGFIQHEEQFCNSMPTMPTGSRNPAHIFQCRTCKWHWNLAASDMASWLKRENTQSSLITNLKHLKTMSSWVKLPKTGDCLVRVLWFFGIPGVSKWFKQKTVSFKSQPYADAIWAICRCATGNWRNDAFETSQNRSVQHQRRFLTFLFYFSYCPVAFTEKVKLSVTFRTLHELQHQRLPGHPA